MRVRRVIIPGWHTLLLAIIAIGEGDLRAESAAETDLLLPKEIACSMYDPCREVPSPLSKAEAGQSPVCRWSQGHQKRQPRALPGIALCEGCGSTFVHSVRLGREGDVRDVRIEIPCGISERNDRLLEIGMMSAVMQARR